VELGLSSRRLTATGDRLDLLSSGGTVLHLHRECKSRYPPRMTRHLYFLVLLLSLGLLTACPTGRTPGGDDDDDDSVGDDDDVADDDDGADDDDTVPDNETDCDDGIDEDEDQLTDCDDPDCAEVAPCWWPDAVDHTGTFAFDGYEIECIYLGFPVPYEVDDCDTAYTSPLTQDLTVEDCLACDRTFEGAFTYSTDTCADLIGSDSPLSGAFGFVFTSETEWEFWGINADSGEWESAGVATDDGSGNFVYQTEGVITDNPPDCDNGDQDLGNLVITLGFSEAP
jgi:hypothetical protein